MKTYGASILIYRKKNYDHVVIKDPAKCSFQMYYEKHPSQNVEMQTIDNFTEVISRVQIDFHVNIVPA